MTVQLIMIREVMSTFSGNELVIGLVLGLWLAYTGIGSAVGAVLAKRRRPARWLCAGHLIVAVVPFLQLTAVRAWPLLWVRGEALDLTAAVVSSIAILAPYCLTSGAMLPLAGSLLGDRNTTDKVYIADSIGDILGGLLFSLVFVFVLSHWDSLVVVGFANLGAAAMLLSSRALPALALSALALVGLRGFEEKTVSWRFPGQAVIRHKNSPYAQLTISRSGAQINVFQDAIPLYATGDYRVEALAHLALSQVDEGADVLLVGGGVFGTIAEAAKHRPRRLDYVELDPAILALELPAGDALSPSVLHTHTGDGRLFIKTATRTYDAVIIDLPDPENTQLNRLYTQEFFGEVKSVLSEGGVLCFTLVGSENYLEEKGLAVNRSVFSALKQVFDHVRVFPGSTHYYLASRAPLTIDVAPILAERRIVTRQFADYDLPTMADPFRIDRLESLLAESPAPPNRDLSPSAFGHILGLWLKKSGSSHAALYFAIGLVFTVAVLGCRRDLARFTVLTSGYAGMSLELCLLLLFQVIFGYVYLAVCGFVTLFMIGSASGAFFSGRLRKRDRRLILACEWTLAALAGLACLAALAGASATRPAALFSLQYVVIPFLIFLAAFAAGCQFAAVSRREKGKGAEITGRLYMADLAGAACGTVLTGLVFLPRIGLIGVLISTMLLKGLSLGLNLALKPPPRQATGNLHR